MGKMVKSTSYFILVIKLGKKGVMSFIPKHYLRKPPNPSKVEGTALTFIT